MSKSRDAFRTISEVSTALDTPAHVLRFWESKFTQVKPVKRAGGRRYYRPADLNLLAGIKKLLHEDGMTIKGAQKLLREQGVKHVTALGETALSNSASSVAKEPVDADVPANTVATPASDMAAVTPTPATITPLETAAPVEPETPLAKPAAAHSSNANLGITNVVNMLRQAEPKSDGPALSLNLKRASHVNDEAVEAETAQDTFSTNDPTPTQTEVDEVEVATADPEHAPKTPDGPTLSLNLKPVTKVDHAPVEAEAAQDTFLSDGVTAPQTTAIDEELATEPEPKPTTITPDGLALSLNPKPATQGVDTPSETTPAQETFFGADHSPTPLQTTENDVGPVTEPTPETVSAEETTPLLIMPNVPADPSDNDSKAPARLFHLLQNTSRPKLATRHTEIAPLLGRMQILRDRIHAR